MRMPPDLDGHGGSQRAWHLVEALRPHGNVHFVLIYRDVDGDCINTSLGPLESRVESVTRINIAGWLPIEGKQFGFLHADFMNLYKMRSGEAPRLSRAELRLIADQLPIRNPDIIFAGRLCSAVILQDLIRDKLISASELLVDFDDIMSKFRWLQAHTMGPVWGRQFKLAAQIDSQVIAIAERRIARTWHAVSVCTDDDLATLRATNRGSVIVKIPNIVTRPYLSPRPPDDSFRVLFVGNLSFPPNSDGLRHFIDQAWPALARAVPHAHLTIVGLRPPQDIVDLAGKLGFSLHANVPSLLPYYEQCDVVIAPILFGSGTRIKILEALAFGRAIVSTSLGSEGIGLQHGENVLLADTMTDFAAALASLAGDPAKRQTIADQGRAFQQQHYTPTSINTAVNEMLTLGKAKANLRQGTRAA